MGFLLLFCSSFLGDNHIFGKAVILVFGERFTLFYGLVFLSGCGLFFFLCKCQVVDHFSVFFWLIGRKTPTYLLTFSLFVYVFCLVYLWHI